MHDRINEQNASGALKSVQLPEYHSPGLFSFLPTFKEMYPLVTVRLISPLGHVFISVKIL